MDRGASATGSLVLWVVRFAFERLSVYGYSHWPVTVPVSGVPLAVVPYGLFRRARYSRVRIGSAMISPCEAVALATASSRAARCGGGMIRTAE